MGSGKKANQKVWLKALALILILAGLFLIFRAADYSRFLTRTGFSEALVSMRGFAQSLGPAAPAAFILASILAIMAYIPAVVVIYFAVCLFGGVRGALISAVSIYAAVTAVFFTARFLGRDLVVRAAGPRLARFESRLQNRGLLSVVYLRLLFFVIPPTNWLLGLSSLKFGDVFWGTVLGTVHHIIIFSWLTEVVVETILSGGSLNPLETKELGVPLLVGAVVFLTVRIIDRSRARRGSGSEPGSE